MILKTIHQEANKLFKDVVDIRRDLHKNPELSNEESRTSKIVSSYLKDVGMEVETNIAGQKGVIGKLKGELSSRNKNRKIALRADMDALPIEEATSHCYKSMVPNVMHACGHDAHTAILLGIANILFQHRKEFSGDIMFIFQPSEEKLPGGALPMLDAGIFDPLPNAVFGQHCIPQIPAGKLGFVPGPMMAAADELYLTITGKGGHGSAPHESKDPITASVQIVSSLQTILSRNFPPHSHGALSITAIQSGTATNIIPDKVKMMGTLRTMDENVRNMAHQRLKDITYSTADAMGVTAELEIRKGYPVLVNSKPETEFAYQKALDFLGKENVIKTQPLLGAEDFAYFLQKTKGTFWQLGVGNKQKGITHNIHSSRFDIDEDSLLVGLGYTAYLSIKYLNEFHTV